jgi:NADPH-dependent ferric siderophore reductase
MTPRDDRPVRKVPHELRPRVLTVQRVEGLGRAMRRVALGGADLAGFTALGPTDHAKIFFPAEVGGDVALPEVRDGVWVNRDDPALTWRDYTVRTYEPGTGEVVFDLAVHAHGPGGRWAARARPGERLGVLGPGTSKVPPLDLAWYVLAADEAGLPALLNWLDRLPAGPRVQAFVEVDGPGCEVPMPVRDGLAVTWVHRGERTAGGSTLLRDAVASAAFGGDDDGAGWVWGAGEASVMRAVRRHVVVERGLPRASVDVTGYWRAGVAHFDHKSPEAKD